MHRNHKEDYRGWYLALIRWAIAESYPGRDGYEVAVEWRNKCKAAEKELERGRQERRNCEIRFTDIKAKYEREVAYSRSLESKLGERTRQCCECKEGGETRLLQLRVSRLEEVMKYAH